MIGNKVLVNAGGPGASIVALNKSDGALIWKSQSDKAGYSSAIPLQVNGGTQVVFFTASALLGLDLNDGNCCGSMRKPANNVANVATPIARGNRVFISSDYGTGGGVVEIKADSKAQEIYFTKDMRNHHSSSVLIGDYLYGFSSAILTAMKFDTGEIAWRDRSVGKGSLVYADGNLYCFSENGVVGLVEATPTGYQREGTLPDSAGLIADMDASGCRRRTAVPARSGYDLRVRRAAEEVEPKMITAKGAEKIGSYII